MKTIAIDFDGVIHRYSKGYQDGSIYDEPVEGAFEAIQHYMRNDYTVFIFSTRSPRQIKRWLEKQLPFDESISTMHAIPVQIIPFWTKFWNKKNVLGITKRKLPAMVYIDDRAIRFKGKWSDMTTTILEIKTWNI